MDIKSIEKACCKPIAIEDAEHDKSLAKCHPQDQSPLFSTLPREIRDLIWTLATAPVEDETKKYKPTEYYYRPGHRAGHKTFTELLFTCRRIWLEANALPMLQAEHCFWYHRRAPDYRTPDWTASLTDLNRRNFGHLHLFAQMFAIEGLGAQKGDVRRYFLNAHERACDFQPRMLHVTIRHTDWWHWEIEKALRFQDRWLQAMLDSPDLRSTQTLKLELETLDYKVDQLQPIVERLMKLPSKEYETHVVNGKSVQTKFVISDATEVYTWTGPANINGSHFRPYKGKDTLKYHVVTLTWHLRFPDMPRANIRELRRAPRIGAPEPSAFTEDNRINDAFPYHPRSSCFIPQTQPVRRLDHLHRMNRLVRQRRRRGEPLYKSQQEEDMHKWQTAQGNQLYLRAVQKYHQDCRHAVERDRFRKLMAPENRERWAAKWKETNSLLTFE